MNPFLRSGLAALLLSFSAAALAWIDTGHMVVADIAKSKLMPDVLIRVNELLKIGGDNRSQDMLGAACWADDVRKDRKETAPWHYIDYYFRTDGKHVVNKPDAENVVWALNRFEPILQDRTKPSAERAEALRWILHFVGDIHQPLHCTAWETDTMPTGDKGGNDVKIKSPVSMNDMARPITNLHALWDFGCGLYRGTERPLTIDSTAKLDAIAEMLMNKYPENKMREARNLDAKRWSKEGFDSAKKNVYPGIVSDEAPSEAYIQHGQEVCGRRIALAGYRLARLLNKLLG